MVTGWLADFPWIQLPCALSIMFYGGAEPLPLAGLTHTASLTYQSGPN